MPFSVIIELDDIAELGILDIILNWYLVSMSGEIVMVDVNPTFRVIELSDPDVHQCKRYVYKITWRRVSVMYTKNLG